MKIVRAYVRIMDSISGFSGKILRWLCVALVVSLCFEVVMRYVFTAPTMWSYELSTMMGVAIAWGGWAYTLRHDGHVRVDVFYSRLSVRKKAIVDASLGILFFFPVIIIVTSIAFNKMLFAIGINELLNDTNWWITAIPIRVFMFLGISLLLLQGVAVFTRNLYFAVRNKTL